MTIPYKIPQEFPIYQRLETLAEQGPPRIVNWWHDTVRDRLVETLWSIIKGTTPSGFPQATSLNDVFTWTDTAYPHTFWHAVYMRIQRQNYAWEGDQYWN